MGRISIPLKHVSDLPIRNEYYPIKAHEDKHAQICVSISLDEHRKTYTGEDFADESEIRDDESLVEKNESLLDQIVRFIAEIDVERFMTPLNTQAVLAHLDPDIEGCDGMLVWKDKAERRKAKLKMQRELNITSVVVTHDMSTANFTADRLAFLLDGKLAFLGTLAEAYKSEQATLRAYLEGGAS